MVQKHSKIYLLLNKLKPLFEKEGLLISAYFVILPILFVFYNEYIGTGQDNIWKASYSLWSLLLVGGLGIVYSWKNKKKLALMALCPVLFYIIHAIGVNSAIWQRNIEYITLLLTSFSFVWLVYRGHVRSLSFLFLMVFSLLFYTKGFALSLGFCYIFLHFLFLVGKENWPIFTTLGLKKSARYLGKSLLYWSPMLLFIVPLKYAQNKIQTNLNQQVYTNTFADSIQFHFHQEFTDSVANLLVPNKNKTTILFVDQKEIVPPVLEDVVLSMAPIKPSIINEVDFEQALKEDTLAYDIITHVLPKYDTLQGRYSTVFLNKINSNVDDTVNVFIDYDLITVMTGNNTLELPYVLVLQDLSLPNTDKSVRKLQPNLEISTLIAFKRLEQHLVYSIENEAGNIDFSVLNNLDKKGKEVIQEQRNALVKQINAHQTSTLNTVANQFNVLFPEPLLELESCNFWEISKLISNEIKRNINKRYVRQKQRAKSKIDNKIKKAYRNIILKIDYQFQKATNKLEDLADDIDTEALAAGTTNISQIISTQIKVAIDEATLIVMNQYQLFFGGWFFYALIGSIAFYFLVLQTFLYIFARISISKRNNLFATLHTSTKKMPKGVITKCGDTYTIAKAEKKVYYVSRIYEPSGRPPKFSIPFKGTSIFSRLKAKAYTMNKVDMSRAGGAVHFRAIGSSEFIEWTLKKGEEVVFDYRNFVAISETVTLKSEVSFRVTTLILGRLFHKIAVGPGKLILITKGRPIISGEKSSNASLAQNRILAWNKATTFDIDSELGITDVYLSGFYLKKMPGDLIIIDADAKGKANLGLFQYIKGLIWPF